MGSGAIIEAGLFSVFMDVCGMGEWEEQEPTLNQRVRGCNGTNTTETNWRSIQHRFSDITVIT